MTKVAIVPEPSADGELAFRAIAGDRQSVARSAGAALDLLAGQLPADDAGMFVIVQSQRPDSLFTSLEQRRLAELMSLWRTARDAGASLSHDEQAELDALVEAETRAATNRAASLLRELGR